MPSIDPRDLADLEALANVGEIVGPVTHEFNNLLNTLLLQIAVLEHSAPNGLREEIAGLKQHGRAAAALIRIVQQYRRQVSAEAPPHDLNEAATAAVAALEAGPKPPDVTLRFTPAASLPSVRAAAADLKRLLTFLLTNAVVSGGNQVAVRTEPCEYGAALLVEVYGASVDAAFVSRLSAPTLSPRDGAPGLELAAARSLVRRLGGNLTAEQCDGGARVTVELPCG